MNEKTAENIRNFVIIAHIDRRESLYSNSLPDNLSVFSNFPIRENSRFPDPFPDQCGQFFKYGKH